MNFTLDQQKVIDASGCDLLVSAAAGSGKTAVLVERIIKMITEGDEPADIDHILVVTFTNAAAAQMREKIAIAVEKKLQENPSDEHLQRQAALVHHAQITTIDKFCVSVIRNHFQDIDLDPSFRIAEEGELKLLRNEVENKVLEDLYEKGDEGFLDMCDTLSPGNNDADIVTDIETLCGTADSYPWPEAWLTEHADDYSMQSGAAGICDTDWWKLGRTYIIDMMAQAVSLCRSDSEICSQPGGPVQYTENVDSDLDMIIRVYDTVMNSSDFDTIRESVRSVSFTTLSRKKAQDVQPELKDKVKAQRDQIKKIVNEISSDYFSFDSSFITMQSQSCAKVLRELSAVALRCHRVFDKTKRERGIIDFGDISHMALTILAEPDGHGGCIPRPAAEEYRSHFREIMIDEYQDSNLVQEFILSSVAGNDPDVCSRFMVGDVKQSIYGFRQARPDLFLEKYGTYSESGKERLICLSRNFRSRTQVVDTVNLIFRKLMMKEFGGIDYDTKAELVLGAEYKEAGLHDYDSEILLFDTSEEKDTEEDKRPEDVDENTDDDPDDPQNLSKLELEAAGIASRIHELMGTLKVTGGDKELRPLKYGDIVILMRSPSKREDTFRRVLEKDGIPVNIVSSSGYFGAYEIRTLLHTMRIISNPRQDIPLYGVLHSCIGKMSDEELAQVRGYDYGCKDEKSDIVTDDLYESCRRYQEQGPDEKIKDKLTSFGTLLKKWRRESEYMPIHQLLQNVILDTDYRTVTSAMMNGGRRIANVDMLLRKAEDFEKTSYYGLYHFIRYIEQLEKYEVDYGEASNPANGADAVQIMSIHKSKGLEFPVCFVSALGTQFNLKDTNANLIVEPDAGIGIKYMDPGERVRMATIQRSIISEKMKRDVLSEEIRVLYVALTRAKEKLIMTSTVDDKMLERYASVCGHDTYEDNSEDAGEDIAEDTAEDTESSSAFEEKGSDEDNEDLSAADIRNSSSMISWILMSLNRYADEKMSDTEKDRTAFSISVKKRSDIKTAQEDAMTDRLTLKKKIEDGSLAAGCPAEIKNKVHEAAERCFDIRYAHDDLKGLFVKTTVSELKIAAMHDEDEAAFDAFTEKPLIPYIPRFAKEDTEKHAGGAERGTAYHRIMELMDFKSMPDNAAEISHNSYAEFVKDEIGRMLSSGRLDNRSASIIDNSSIVRFLETDTAHRMACADRKGKLFRERPFSSGIRASRLDVKFPADEMVMIQGIIDAFWQEDEGYVLLDYKTDLVHEADELMKRYQKQLDLYAEALGQMHMDVKERLLYSFRLNEEVQVI